MNSQAPTLFDDFFLQDDESSQNHKSVKKTTRKKKLDPSLSLFDLGNEIDENSREEQSEIKDELPQVEVPLPSINKKVAIEETISIQEEETTISSTTEDELESSDITAFIQQENTPVNEVEELINEESEQGIQDTNIDDIKVLENQYLEAIGSYGIAQDFFLPDEEMSNDDVEIEDQEMQKEEDVDDESNMDIVDAFQPEDWNLTKHYYSIGEVANMFNVNISHIRFWTNEFKLKPRTNKKGNRYYTPSQIETLQLIHYLVKVKKHTIKGAQEKLKVQKKLVQNNMQLKDSLIDLKSKLEELKNHF